QRITAIIQNFLTNNRSLYTGLIFFKLYNRTDVLNVKEPSYSGHLYTWDNETNLYARENDAEAKKKYLDYIFLSKKHLLPNGEDYKNIVQMVKAKREE
ncbi:hypothetical protein BK728_18570, partial [Bacillus thuringiensis serovar chanpaisis]